MLDKLPIEVILLTTDHIRQKRDLISLSQVSKHLYHLLTPIIYKSIILSSSEWDIWDLKIDAILKYSARHVRFVKNLELAAPFHRRLRTRCSEEDDSEEDDLEENYSEEDDLEDDGSEDDDSEDDDSEDDDSEDDGFEESNGGMVELNRAVSTDGFFSDIASSEADGASIETELDGAVMDGDAWAESTASVKSWMHDRLMMALESRLIPLLECIPEGELQTFSWNLGICVPKKVIQSLSTRQPQLGSLSIITDSSCTYDLSLSLDGLEELYCLRSACFVPANFRHATTIGRILQRNAHSLKKIAFHRQDSFSDRHDWEEINKRNSFIHEMLDLLPGARCPLFRSLRNLELSFVSFQNGIDDMVTILNFPQLTSLKLRDCSKMNELFMSLAHSSQCVQLKCLEVNLTGAYPDQTDIMPLILFLRSLNGLRDLFILCRPLKEQSKDFWLSIDHHKSTLQRFIYQQSTLYDSRSDPDLDTLWGLDFINSIGICCKTQELATSLRNAPIRPKITFLHIRQTGLFDFTINYEATTERADLVFLDSLPSVIEFAKWAFGPHGLPELHVLAYGDFTYRGRQPSIAWGRSDSILEANIVSQKGVLPFREITGDDTRLWERLQENLDFLEACPEDSLLHHF